MKPMLRPLLVLGCLVSSRAPSSEAAEGGVMLTEAVQLKVADAFMDEGDITGRLRNIRDSWSFFPTRTEPTTCSSGWVRPAIRGRNTKHQPGLSLPWETDIGTACMLPSALL